MTRENLPASKSTLGEVIERYRDQLIEAIPRGMISPERFLKLALLAEARNPALKRCEVNSLLLALMEAASLGLDPSGSLGHAYIVPYIDKRTGITRAQLIVGYRGYIYLAHQTGIIRDIYAAIVCEGDDFSISLGTHRDLVHVPRFASTNVVGAYAVAELQSGILHYEYLTKERIDQIKARSKAQEGPWLTDYAEMAKKTAVRALIKYLPFPLDSLISSAVALEEAQEYDEPAIVGKLYTNLPQTQSAAEKLVATIRKRKKVEPLPQPEEPPKEQPKTEEKQETLFNQPPLDDSKLMEALRRNNLMEAFEARRNYVTRTGGDFSKEYADLCCMDPKEAVDYLRNWYDVYRRT